MNHLKWMGHSATMQDIHKSMQVNGDVSLITNGNCVRAHRIVLASCSDMLRTILSEMPVGEECIIMVPDMNVDVLENIISFIYFGETYILASNLTDFLEAVTALGIKSPVSLHPSKDDKIDMQLDNPIDYVVEEFPSGIYTNEICNVECIENLDENTLSSIKSDNKADILISTDEVDINDIEEEMNMLTQDFCSTQDEDSQDYKNISQPEPSSEGVVHEIVKNAYELAVEAVISKGLSLQKAAEKFGISKTVLWRRVHKSPYYVKQDRCSGLMEQAYERLKKGEQLKRVSLDLDIPISTLHRHKARLIRDGLIPNMVNPRRIDSFHKKDLKLRLAKAMNVCIHEGMSLNHAAILYDLPKSTLWRHLQKRHEEAKKTMLITEDQLDLDLENINMEVKIENDQG